MDLGRSTQTESTLSHVRQPADVPLDEALPARREKGSAAGRIAGKVKSLASRIAGHDPSPSEAPTELPGPRISRRKADAASRSRRKPSAFVRSPRPGVAGSVETAKRLRRDYPDLPPIHVLRGPGGRTGVSVRNPKTQPPPEKHDPSSGRWGTLGIKLNDVELGRNPLLAEGVPQRRTDPRGETQSAAQHGFRIRQSDVAPVGLGSESWGKKREKSQSHASFTIPLSQSTQKALQRPQSGEKAKTASSAREKATISLSKSGGEERKYDPRFPTRLHHDVHKMSPEEAHKTLDKLWDRRHDVNPADRPRKAEAPNKYMLPHAMPGMHHPDKSVRERAWKMAAQAHANTMGASYSQPKTGRRTTPKVLAKVMQHRKTGERHIATSFPTKPGERRPSYDVVHSVKSEWLTRTNLLAEGMPQREPWEPDPARIRAGTTSIRRRLRRRELSPKERLKQTEVLPALQKRKRPKDEKEPDKKHPTYWRAQMSPSPMPTWSRYRDPKTGKEVKLDHTDLQRSPLINEVVANTFVSKFAPGSSALGATGPTHDRAQTTAKLGLVTQQGGVNPGRRHRKEYEKKLKKIKQRGTHAGKKERDRISKELGATQPTKIGGVLDGIAMLKRTRLKG